MGRNKEAMQRAADRREHEDSAARLAVEVPALSSLKLEVEDGRGATFGSVAHVRHVVVATAPSLFEMPCGDRSCKDGGHDMTREIVSALRNHQTRFEGEHECDGSIGTDGGIRCARVMRYVGTATYTASPSPSPSQNTMPDRSERWSR